MHTLLQLLDLWAVLKIHLQTILTDQSFFDDRNSPWLDSSIIAIDDFDFICLEFILSLFSNCFPIGNILCYSSFEISILLHSSNEKIKQSKHEECQFFNTWEPLLLTIASFISLKSSKQKLRCDIQVRNYHSVINRQMESQIPEQRGGQPLPPSTIDQPIEEQETRDYCLIASIVKAIEGQQWYGRIKELRKLNDSYLSKRIDREQQKLLNQPSILEGVKKIIEKENSNLCKIIGKMYLQNIPGEINQEQLKQQKEKVQAKLKSLKQTMERFQKYSYIDLGQNIGKFIKDHDKSAEDVRNLLFRNIDQRILNLIFSLKPSIINSRCSEHQICIMSQNLINIQTQHQVQRQKLRHQEQKLMNEFKQLQSSNEIASRQSEELIKANQLDRIQGQQQSNGETSLLKLVDLQKQEIEAKIKLSFLTKQLELTIKQNRVQKEIKTFELKKKKYEIVYLDEITKLRHSIMKEIGPLLEKL